MGYKVTSAYATLRVPNDLGQETLVGFYEGAILPAGVNQDDLKRHIRKNMVEKVKDEPAPKPTEKQSEPGAVPAGNASREAWATYATGKGAPAEETKPVEEGGLKQAELRAKYGG